MAEELDVKQPTASRLLNGLLAPGRELIFKIQGLYYVPAAWWGEEPLSDGEREPVPARPERYAKGAA
jgi:transcriptional regulator with XRE-family HTH domain